jgi:hypothetical protein
MRTHAILLVIGLCAAVVVYGVGTTLTADEKDEKEETSASNEGKTANDEVISRTMEKVPNSPGILKEIIVTKGGMQIKFYREIKVPGGRRLIPWKPPKPKRELSTEEKEKIQRQGKGLAIQ